MFNFDIKNVPFARAGSYLTFSLLPPEWNQPGLYLRTMHRGSSHQVFSLSLLRNDEAIDYQVDATPSLACLRPSDGSDGLVEICLPETEVARIRVTGGLTFRMKSEAEGRLIYAFPLANGRVKVNAVANKTQYEFIPLTGRLQMDMPVHISDHQRKPGTKKPIGSGPLAANWVPDENGVIEFIIHEHNMSAPRIESPNWTFEQSLEQAEAHWSAWQDTTPEVSEEWREAALQASHVNYASTVGKSGFLKRETTLMSRNWMTSCWSWDHCFNALAYAPKNPDLAWDQLNTHFDLQEPGGCLPDGINAELCGWNFCKPPIHGWTLGLMEKLNPALLTEERLKDFYPKLVKWTDWWFEQRDADGDGLPEYQHGNDSGWDNSTAFDVGFPSCAVDLQGHLINQMGQLASMAERLGKKSESARWIERRDLHIERMIERMWDEKAGQFFTFQALTGKRETVGNSLLNHMIIVIGELLPQPYRDKVAAFLEPDGPFVTQYGPATEAPDSPKYLEAGYWRGPIWPSSTVLLVDGLRRGGYLEQAKEIARRHCDMTRRSMLFAENFDPLTGAPLCDKAYTWGSSGFLYLAHDLLR